MIVDPDFPDHWKTRMLVGLLGNDESAPMLVIRLWAHCQLRKQWTFDKLTPASLKALCRFPGHANLLESSLVASGFVRREGETLIVSGWDDYNAALIAAWENGKKSGGRPPKNPRDNPGDTQGLTIRGEKKREDRDTHTPGMRREEIPPDLLTQAKRLVALYLSVVTAAHPAGRSAEDAAANAMACHPTRLVADWERAIRGYGEQMDRNDCPKPKRQSPKRFFEDGTWEQYIDGVTPQATLSHEEKVAAAIRQNKLSEKRARGEAS